MVSGVLHQNRPLKTVMHYGYLGISKETNLLSAEKVDLYISHETFLCSIPETIP